MTIGDCWLLSLTLDEQLGQLLTPSSHRRPPDPFSAHYLPLLLLIVWLLIEELSLLLLTIVLLLKLRLWLLACLGPEA
jgi:hypothetical protein